MARTFERPNRYFTFLRRLRAEGRSNMYGAIPYLAAAFGIDRNESFRIVCEWVDGQEALAGAPARPKSAIPAERAASPTLFDPVPEVKAPDKVRGSSGRRKARTPVKQREQKPRAAARKKPVAAATGKPVAAPPKKPDASSPKKPGKPSDSRAA